MLSKFMTSLFHIWSLLSLIQRRYHVDCLAVEWIKEIILHQYTSAILINNREITVFHKIMKSGAKLMKYYVTHPILMHPNRNTMSIIFNTSTKRKCCSCNPPHLQNPNREIQYICGFNERVESLRKHK